MKTLLIAALLSSAFMARAQEQTDVNVDPSHSYECTNGNKRNLNSIYGAKVVSETNEEISVQFYVVYGDCRDGKFVPDQLNPESVQFYFMDNRTNWPWQTAPYRYQTARYRSNSIVIARVTFSRQEIMDATGAVDLQMEVSREAATSIWGAPAHQWRLRIRRHSNSSEVTISNR